MSALPQLTLAADHRVQLIEAAANAGQDLDACRLFKRLVVEGFLRARDRSQAVRAGGALILDRLLGQEALALARREGVPVGQPAEVSGAWPLELDPLLREEVLAAKPAFIKVLVKGRPDDPPERRALQHGRLRTLAAGCASHGVPLLAELIVPPLPDEDEARFEAMGRARLTAEWMSMLHGEGVVPAAWKLEGFDRPEAARWVAEAARPGQPIVVLGKSASAETLSEWFRAARRSPAFTGFAVGRSIFWQPFESFLSGGPRAEVVRTIRDGYLDVVRRWEEAAG